LVNKYFQDKHTFYLLVVITCDRILWSRNKLNFENISSSLAMDIVGVRAQDRILGLGFCPRTLIGLKRSKDVLQQLEWSFKKLQ